MEGHTGQTIYFSDRPERIVGAVPTADFLKGLGVLPDKPPNAALVGKFRAEQEVAVLELIEPRYDAEAGTLVYGAEVLEGCEGENLTPVLAEQVAERLPAEFGPAALFIDDCPGMTRCVHGFADWIDVCGPIPDVSAGRACSGACNYTVDYLNGLCNDAYGSDCHI